MTALAARSEVRLTVLASPPLHPVYAGLPGVRLSPLDPRVRGPLDAWALGRALAGADDVAIVLPRSFSSALLPALARIPRRVGRVGDARSRLLTEPLPAPPVPEGPIRGPVRYDKYGNVVGNIYIRKVEKKGGNLVNTVIKTYPNVSQFWTYDPDEFLKSPVYNRDSYPANRFLEP